MRTSFSVYHADWIGSEHNAIGSTLGRFCTSTYANAADSFSPPSNRMSNTMKSIAHFFCLSVWMLICIVLAVRERRNRHEEIDDNCICNDDRIYSNRTGVEPDPVQPAL